MTRYLITPPALWDDPPEDDFPGEQLPVGNDSDAPWLPVDKEGLL